MDASPGESVPSMIIWFKAHFRGKKLSEHLNSFHVERMDFSESNYSLTQDKVAVLGIFMNGFKK